MMSRIFPWTAVILSVCCHLVWSDFNGEDYWNSRYGNQGIAYTSIDRRNGLWSDQPDLQGPYLYPKDTFTGEEACRGCSCNDKNKTVLSCTGPIVILKGKKFPNITAGTFEQAVTSISIFNCPNFELFEDKTFENLTGLQDITVQGTILNHVPDLSNTAVTIVNLASNAIKMTTLNHAGWSLPSTITHLALMENNIHWIPNGWLSGPNLRIVSLSGNDLPQLMGSVFGDVSALVYLGLDGNRIKTLSKSGLAPLATSNFVHLNVSNNVLTYIQPGAVNLLTELRIIELHQNSFRTIKIDTFYSHPNLLHIDLNHNNLARLTSRSFQDLPKLMELRLHSQKTPMTVIEYDAWRQIGDELVYLFVSDNELATFPHQVLLEETYPKLKHIYADHNQIRNATELGKEAYSFSYLHAQKLADFTPFSTYPVLNTLHLDENWLTHVYNTDYCSLTVLQNLYLGNRITEDNMDPDAFQCLSGLKKLSLSGNLIQYVPTALKRDDALPAITTLELNSNKLTFIETGAFSNLTTLTSLDLNGNSIIVVEDDSLPDSLTHLDMQNNNFRFTHQHPFSDLNSLSDLDLRSNEIDNIPADAFQNCTSLSNLYMSANRIPRLLRSHFENSPLSGTVLFNNNEIGYIEDGTFAHVSSMEELSLNNNQLVYLPQGGDFTNMDISRSFDLSNNRIVSLPENVFTNLAVGEDFVISNNMITTIKSNAFNGFSSKNLDLRGSHVRHLYTNAFTSVSLTEDLFLSGLNIAAMPTHVLYDVSAKNIYLQDGVIAGISNEAFYDVVVSESMDLRNNAITEIFSPVFGGTSSVGAYFYLNGNKLQEMSASALNNVVLTSVDLSDNKLSVYPLALATQKLQRIDISNNQIHMVPADSFSGQTTLEILHLDNNTIPVLQNGLMDDLTGLQYLSVADNVITSVDDGVFNNLVRLLTLNLARNQLSHFPALSGTLSGLSDIDLTDNIIETVGVSAFTSLSNLTRLDLTGNPLGCHCQLVETLYPVADKITGGECEFPVATDGIGFNSTLNSTYFVKQNYSLFQCTAENVAAIALSDTDVQVTWDKPSTLYANINIGDPAPAVSSAITYSISCVSPSAATLSTTETDVTASSSSYSVTFGSADGVVAGTTYECSVKTEIDGYTSAKSIPSTVVTPTSAASGGSAGVSDVELNITYYDFSRNHPDFSSDSYIAVSKPSYIASPYGSWLAVSASPTSDTFSSWYRDVLGTNQVVTSTMILMAQTGTVKRYWSGEFYPVDGQGYQAESQMDCSGTSHNFGFTSAIRTGLVFAGTEQITFGGGEATWLYVNGVLMAESLSTLGVNVKCYKIDLSPAANSGGGVITPQQGTVTGGACTGFSPLLSAAVTMELEVGEIYHFDLFHAETRTCTSEFFLEVSGMTFITDPVTQVPMDYTVSISEDFHVDGILESLKLTDIFSVGTYQITLYAGNEARHFNIKEDTLANQNASVFVADGTLTNTTVTANNGTSISYFECTGTITDTVVNNSASEVFPITTTTALVTLATELDYEILSYYYLMMTVEDTGLSLTGTLAIRILVTDANDNCPVISPTSFSVTPAPVLSTSPIVTFSTFDTDTGINAEITYVVTMATLDPEWYYNTSYDLWREIYPNSTTLTFQVIAMDKGTPPRGSSATLNVTLSNTCIVNALFEPVAYEFVPNDTSGDLFLRIPKYYINDFFICDDYVGMSNGRVFDSQITASSSFDAQSGPGRARVNQTENVYSLLAGGWIAGSEDQNQFIQVDMKNAYKFTAVHIQGRDGASEWVTSFKLYYSDNSVSWSAYTDKEGHDIFNANTDSDTMVTQALDPPILGQYIRVNPQTWTGRLSMRLEFSGCTQLEQFYYDTSCISCETTYYCEGDGQRKTCGRCDPPDPMSPCGRNPVEHSFGSASECSSCPIGWLCKDGYASICEVYHYVECNSTYCPEACTQCEPGYACLDGRRTLCGPGTFSTGQQKFCEACEAGQYQDLEGQSSCKSCPSGYYSAVRSDRCLRCQSGEYTNGNASGCLSCHSVTECPCLTGNKCHPSAGCLNIGGGAYECGDCPEGYTGDGTNCIDINECEAYMPCWNVSSCINTEPGYQCLECPEGYTGTYEDAYAWNVTRRVFIYMNTAYASVQVQTCSDVDECLADNGRCDPLMTCVNTIGSYYCGFCAEGYMGDAVTGCYSSDFCASGAHDCTTGATCVYVGPAVYRCECSVGYAGNGAICSMDTDLDGLPDAGQPCSDWTCIRDNCPMVSNSNQEDTDGDSLGDNCDNDDDRDGVADTLDNCQWLANFHQADSDSDGVGDVCDNCPSVVNADQLDTDRDGQGDACDTDDDDDGFLDGSDNCPLVVNAGQENTGDADSVGDACDNCVYVDNDDQLDTDQNGVGDACDPPGGLYKDKDGDGVLDFMDNCVTLANGDQSDIDGDGSGDLCDTDIDGDGVINSLDNCPYRSNSLQLDTNGDGTGDDCATDSDGDSVVDKNDTCPYNPAISVTSFLEYFTVDLDPSLAVTVEPYWLVKNHGEEVMQLANTEMPTMLIGGQSYGAVQYSGTWFVTNSSASDYVGFVFGFVNNRKFYVVMWKSVHYNYGSATYKAGLKGIQIKVVDSTTGPSASLAEALWHSDDTTNQVYLIWQDANLIGWQPQTAYRWRLQHKPSIGYISLSVYQGSSLLVDSGSIYDFTITGGRLGVFQFGAYEVIWAYLKAECLSHTNKGLYLDGVDDYVKIADVTTLQLDRSFTFEAWFSLSAGFTTGPYPLFCSGNSTVCIWVESAVINGHFGDSVITTTTTLSADTWYNVIYRYNYEEQTFTMFVNGVNEGQVSMVSDIDWSLQSGDIGTMMYLGRDNTTFFKGTLDEIRLYGQAVPDTEIMAHIQLVSIERPLVKNYGNLHFKMEEPTGATALANSGLLAVTAELTGGTFVESYQDYQQFQLTYPTNR